MVLETGFQTTFTNRKRTQLSQDGFKAAANGLMPSAGDGRRASFR